MNSKYDKLWFEQQQQIIDDLIHMNNPMKQINLINPDIIDINEPKIASLTRQNIISALEKFLMNHFTSDEMYRWANTLSFLQCVDREKGYNDPIAEVIDGIVVEHCGGFPLTQKDAFGYIKLLKSAKYKESN